MMQQAQKLMLLAIADKRAKLPQPVKKQLPIWRPGGIASEIGGTPSVKSTISGSNVLTKMGTFTYKH